MPGRVWPIRVFVITALAAGLLAGCSGSGKPARPGTPTGNRAGLNAVRCGTARTAAGVPVNIEVEGGTAVRCPVALAVERAYAAAILAGRVPGNGGGAPVTIRGWVCQGYNTPEVLATGRTSRCHKDGMQILAVLPDPAAATASP